MLYKQFIRGLVIFGMLLGETAISNAAVFNNSELLNKGVKLKLCIYKQSNTQYWNHKSFSYQANKIGAIVYPIVKKYDNNTISISIIPYIITNKDQRFYLLPEVPDKLKKLPFKRNQEDRECRSVENNEWTCKQKFADYFPACKKNSYHLAYNNPELYPTVLLSVDKTSDIKNLKNLLSQEQKLEFLDKPVKLSKELKSQLKNGKKKGMGILLSEYIFKNKRAKFLERLQFPIEVKIAGSQKGPITFKSGSGYDVANADTTSCTEHDNKLLELKDELDKTSEERDEFKKRAEHFEKLVKKMIDFVKEVDNDKLIKNSLKPIETGHSSGHKLIIVSLSNSRELKSKARVIQKSFREVLSELKQNHSNTQFTLLTIGSSRTATVLLTDADLLRLHDDSDISGKINTGIQFGASDLKALADLKSVDQMIQDKSITSVLYLTDNKRLNSNPPNIERGLPLAWHEAGIHLTVLTTEKCKVWKEVKAECTTDWKNKRGLKKALKAFLR